MSLYVDKSFIPRISMRLDKFAQKGDYLWNFRCPLCGDSRKNKLKARGFIYKQKNGLFYKCHNCSASTSFGNFLKSLDPNLYKEYRLETYKETSHSNTPKPDFSAFQTYSNTNEKLNTKKIDLPTIKSLPEGHIAKDFLRNRQIPKEYSTKFYYSDNFKSFVSEILPDSDYNLIEDRRIVIPFYDESGALQGFQGRDLGNSRIKYITIKVVEGSRKVFGLETVDLTRKVYVVEGPLDSIFLNNGIAMMDSALYRAPLVVGAADYTFIYDNESRNKQIVQNMRKTITMGLDICIWPKNVEEKDINDMVLSGISASMVQGIIDKHTHSGLKAKMEFEAWQKT